MTSHDSTTRTEIDVSDLSPEERRAVLAAGAAAARAATERARARRAQMARWVARFGAPPPAHPGVDGAEAA